MFPRLIFSTPFEHIEKRTGPVRSYVESAEEHAEVEGNDHAPKTHEQAAVPEHSHHPVRVARLRPRERLPDHGRYKRSCDGYEIELGFFVFFPHEDCLAALDLVLDVDQLLYGVVRAVVGHRQNAVGGCEPRVDLFLHMRRLRAISAII